MAGVLKRTWLVQRLKAPLRPEFPKSRWYLDLDGNIPESSIKLREGVHRYDYMGSAEFEFGEVGRCAQRMIEKRDTLFAGTLTLDKKNIALDYRNYPVAPPSFVFYLISQTSKQMEAMFRIKELARNLIKTKESTGLSYIHEPGNEIVGWLDLNNDFYFFIDRDMWEATFFLYTGKRP